MKVKRPIVAILKNNVYRKILLFQTLKYFLAARPLWIDLNKWGGGGGGGYIMCKISVSNFVKKQVKLGNMGVCYIFMYLFNA